MKAAGPMHLQLVVGPFGNGTGTHCERLTAVVPLLLISRCRVLSGFGPIRPIPL
jgi:hypothetical protein